MNGPDRQKRLVQELKHAILNIWGLLKWKIDEVPNAALFQDGKTLCEAHTIQIFIFQTKP